MNHSELGTGQPAFLLAQVGAHAASRFAERLNALQLSPPDAGVLRLLRMSAGISQQELAARLRIHPSRLVAIVDNLEKRKFVERKVNPDDRRLYSLQLTNRGVEILGQIGKVAREHQDALLSALNSEERVELALLLHKVADQQGLARGVHPGYQRLRKPKRGVVKDAQMKTDRRVAPICSKDGPPVPSADMRMLKTMLDLRNFSSLLRD
jgi:DNA-binding MarR family transcriptional regulator